MTLPVPGSEWQLMRRLGAGSTSEVWLARRRDAPTPVALKIGRSRAQAPLLANEAERSLFLSSAFGARLVDVGVLATTCRAEDGLRFDAGLPFLAVEHAPGQPLDALSVPDDLREELTLSVARDIGLALSALHRAGVAHGDVKPANVVVEREPERWSARLVDLGLVAELDAAVPQGGTPRYLNWDDVGSSDARARDLWALGVTLLECAAPTLVGVARPAEAHHEARLSTAMRELVTPLLAASGGVRPSARWVHRRALTLGAPALQPGALTAYREQLVEQTYLVLRRRELLRAAASERLRVAVGGTSAGWLERAHRLARRCRLLRGGTTQLESFELGPLDALDRARWLVHLIGPSAAAWPALPLDDSALADRLIELCGEGDPESFSLSALESKSPVTVSVPSDVLELAAALGAGAARPELLDAAERWVLSGEAPGLALPLGRALRRGGQLGRALLAFSRSGSELGRVEAAETRRRAGDRDAARRELEGVELAAMDDAAHARGAASLARLELDAGGLEAARALLAGAPETAATLETRALVELSAGPRSAVDATVRRARLRAGDDEERARIEAVAGNLAHASGDAAGALERFRRAAEYASRTSALLEEATYLTGVAAAGADVGELGEALLAAERAMLLFEHLGRTSEAARAQLSRAAVFAQCGRAAEARAAAADCIERARVAADARCRAFAHLTLAEVLPEEDRDAIEHAEWARRILSPGSADDELRIAAQLLTRSAALDTASVDALARSSEPSGAARLSWWGARARVEARRPSPERPQLVLAELLALSLVKAPTALRGVALSHGAELARRIGDGESARRLFTAANEAARELLRRAPPELRAAVAGLPWVAQVAGDGRTAAIAPEQIAEVESLVRALSRRDRLRPLLDQVLDALVLWTGVERGLLLLRAPGGKLVPRAARNLARSDLTGPQLELSMSLAERALSERAPVVAVDATYELPEVHASVHALKLRSVLSVPLLARGEALGVVYLDDRARRGAFGPAELAWVRLLSTIAALAIAEARDQLLLRRAALRAQRAEARVAEELARREAELDSAERELARTRDRRETRFSYGAIIGSSQPLRAMLAVVDRVTTADVPVLVIGESGSGKELVARAIHENGPRAKGPFVSENCAAIPEGLLESTLFGHVRGAFTGASRPRAGLFEIAHQGTLFLDEIAEMSLGMQSKLLRVLEDGELRPVGSERARHVDVRVIGATHRDLEAMVRAGTFRRDLFYRLQVISVRVPPLRERSQDIPVLVRHFVERHGGGRRVRITRAALEALRRFGWPGNIRQLENEVRRALVLADEVIDVQHLSPEVVDRAPTGADQPSGLNLRQRVDALELELLTTALRRTGGNQTRAAELLGLSRFGLQKMMKRLEISPALYTGLPEETELSETR